MVGTRSAKKRAKRATESSCGVCDQPDDLQMVQCDRCERWFHYSCVNVSEDVSERQWMCEGCHGAIVITPEKEQEPDDAITDPFQSPMGVSMSDGPRAEVEVRLSTLTKTNYEGDQAVTNMRLELLRLEEENMLKMSYIKEKYAIMRKHEGEEPTSADATTIMHDAHRRCTSTERKMDVSTKDAAGDLVLNRKFESEIKNMSTCSLSQAQINARQVVPKELPAFNGDSEDWPVFFSSFENSTRMCGFNNDENLLRLQRALKGKARECVRSKLMIPALVPKIMSTLKMMFGRPEAIIGSLVAKLRVAPCVNQNKLETLISFALEVENLTTTMEAADMQGHLDNPILLQEVLEKLPGGLALQWAIHKRMHERANLLTFSEWLFDMAESASTVVPTMLAKSKGNSKDAEQRKPQHLNFHKATTTTCCYFCNKEHLLQKCDKFSKLGYNDKWEQLIKMKLCRHCLKKHNYRFCSQQKRCGIDGCEALHHQILHKPEFAEQVTCPANVIAVHNAQTSNVLYKIVPITIHGKYNSVNVYAFLDDGSGPTLIEKGVVDELQLKGKRQELCLRWTDGTIRSDAESEMMDLRVSQQMPGSKVHTLRNVHSIKSLELPVQTMKPDELMARYKHLKGLPVQAYCNAEPKMIIGLNNKNVTMPLKFREGKSHEPAATKTRLGWTIYGISNPHLSPRQHTADFQLHICECTDDVALQKLVMQSMQLEEDFGKNTSLVKGKQEELEDKVIREGDKFTAKLLWKSDDIQMPNNYDMALRRLQCFERKLSKDEDTNSRVCEHIVQMEDKGYIRKLSLQEVEEKHPRLWYLPMFTVRNPNKPKKTRVVWDAAAKYAGVCLNDCLLKGPDLLTSLPGILFNFRVGKVGVSGDISEMFHRVNVQRNDQNAQRFLWRHSEPHREPDVYALQVLSFGASCSPSLAQFAKNKNAKEHEELYPRAAKSIIERHYVDDMLDSTNSVEDAIQLALDVRKVHAYGGFHIRNWLSNSPEVLQAVGDKGDIDEFCKAGRLVDHVVEPNKILGMWWSTIDDNFTFNLKFTKADEEVLNGARLPTKRELLRLIMSIFDPLGLLSFFTIYIKMLMQDVWRKGTDWDEEIAPELTDAWNKWLGNLKNVEGIRIPRCYFSLSSSDESHIQLHVFVDAGERAYAAVSYFRVESTLGVETALVCAKAKVAPLRPVSIPRMELLAAVLGTRLATSIINGHDVNINSVHYWCDSKTVLHWLNSDPMMYKQFVKFRVAEIQEATDVLSWRYVPTKMNVADLATKWSRPPNFDVNSTWFKAPNFLKSPMKDWPMANEAVDHNSGGDIESTEIHQHAAVLEERPIVDVSRFSKWERLLRAMAYVKVFIKKLRTRLSGEHGSNLGLSSDVLSWSERFLIRLAQGQAYGREIVLLDSGQNVVLAKSSALRRMSPFIDDLHILRMRSRLENAACVTDAVKNPIIMPKQHYVTYLIVDWYHRKYKHVHHETVINEVFQKFHVPGLRSLIRSVRSKCRLCKLRYVKPCPPEMGWLPEARLKPFFRPFSYVGIDFFGPYLVTTGRRTEKRYGAIFTCLTCRAVHIEVVHSLSMSSCIMAIRNFIARRGRPLVIYSDNGTNLKAAEKELRKAHEDIDFPRLKGEFTSMTMQWVFIPPGSPHMGGAWERLVRSIKTVMNQVITPDTKINDEKLVNLMVEAESIVNSRPLSYLSLDTAEQEALTPNHFLLGSSSGSKPPGRFDTTDQFVKRSWRHSQLMADNFWKRWVLEVMPDLTKRTKWFDKVAPIQVGDVAVIVDNNLPRHTWPKGIVTRTIVGKDGQVRSAVVRTTSGEYHRPAAKLAILDVRSHEGSLACN